eukprot:gnl/MRDRNA2_/MRDRNA2_62510_c0_seq3.p1 gnl/MRDRNA2_/MRDRNA2_62510_c0~~gnl/MRDRNA2_/MRDRNA2_62510_c0_seq3.p1  ORF type:complete len:228 (+),score=47.74 gnl/MRDRNA2_/MRDRNA2_62510_c0_seq3:95-778(+)
MSTLMNKWFGESQKLIRAVFSLANKLAPTIIFIDEVDSIAPSRDSTGIHNFEVSKINELLHQMDGIKLGNSHDKVVVICATNRPWALDVAMKRRLPLTIYLGPPSVEDRRQFVEHTVRTNPGVFHSDVTSEIKSVVDLTEGYSFSAMDSLFREAARKPIMQGIRAGTPIEKMKSEDVQVKFEHIRDAALRVKKDINDAQVERFQRWNAGEDVTEAPPQKMETFAAAD